VNALLVFCISIVSAVGFNPIPVPATRVLNCKSTPDFCKNIPLPAPTLLAVFASPLPTTLTQVKSPLPSTLRICPDVPTELSAVAILSGVS